MDSLRPVDAPRPIDTLRSIDPARPVDAAETVGSNAVSHLQTSPTPIPQLDGDASDDEDPGLDLSTEKYKASRRPLVNLKLTPE